MPYGRKSRTTSRAGKYLARGRTARQAKFAKNRTTVARIQRKKYVPKIVKNTQSLYALSRAVNQLQRSKLGDYQCCFEKIGLQLDYPAQVEHPLCFCVNDFNNGYVANVGAPIYRGNGATSLKYANFQDLTSFPVGFDSCDYHYKTEGNEVSKIIYAPISSTITVQAHKDMATGDEPIMIRVDIVRQKKVIHNALRQLMLPFAVTGLGKMCNENAAVRNRYNSEFLQVLQTKYIYLNNKDSALKEVRRQVKFYCKFDPKRPLRTDSDADGSANNENDFYTNIDPKRHIWCVINFSTNNLTGVDLNIFRTNRWYDQHGTD